MSPLIKGWYVFILLVLISGCAPREGLAPVVESNWQPRGVNSQKHVVRRGETLYAIAFRHDQDYRTIAEINHLKSPYSLRIGQVLYLDKSDQPKNIATTAKPRPKIKQKTPKRQLTAKQEQWPLRGRNGWLWPARGKIATKFTPRDGKKGIDIAVKRGEKVHAASGGIVAYAGNGLGGYGNLIIIKHNNQFLTAYGNNLRNLVKEGQHVKAGQTIAEIGVVDRRFWGVHFEIRKAGKPVNPLIYLGKG